MIHALRTKNLGLKFYTFNPKVVLLQSKESLENGVVVRTSVFETFDCAGSFAEFKSEDFDVASLLSVGALQKLQLTYMSSMHDMNVADSFQNLKFEDDVKV